MIPLGCTVYYRKRRCMTISQFSGKYRVRFDDGTRRVVRAEELKRTVGTKPKDDAIAYAARMNGLTRRQAWEAMG